MEWMELPVLGLAAERQWHGQSWTLGFHTTDHLPFKSNAEDA